jgi:hypothetical protein
MERNGTALLFCVFMFQLFDFDLEVQPALEVLVGKTVESALVEVLEEEELATLRAQQRRFLQLRAGGKLELQRLEAQDGTEGGNKVIAADTHDVREPARNMSTVVLPSCDAV